MVQRYMFQKYFSNSQSSTLFQKFNLFCYVVPGEGSGGSLDAHASTCEAWFTLLQVTSPTL